MVAICFIILGMIAGSVLFFSDGLLQMVLSPRQNHGIICQILFIVLVQALITAGLHCAELETQLIRLYHSATINIAR
jgi:hypothetical protein